MTKQILTGTLADQTGKNYQVSLTAELEDQMAKPWTGANDADWGAIEQACGTLTGYRSYNAPDAGPHGIPAVFPGSGKTVPSGAAGVISIKPDIAMFLAGALDTAVTTWAKLIPAGSMVTFWHEGERENEGHAAADIVAMHKRAYGLVKAAQPDCAYGQVITSYSATNTMRVVNWTAPGMDFYGIDAYPASSSETAASTIGPCVTQLRQAAGQGIALALTEVNTSGHVARPQYLTDAWALAKGYEMFAYLWFFAQNGTGNDWNPADQATISAMRAINSDSSQ